MDKLHHSLLQWNINGYVSHLEMFQVLLKEENPTVVALQETHFKEMKTYCPKNFNGFHKTRENQQKASGGVSILVRKDINATEIPVKSDLEVIAVSIMLSRKINICNIYIPPSKDFTVQDIDKILTQIPSPQSNGSAT